MRQKGLTTSLVERIEIGERSQAGQSDRQIAQAMDRALSTVRKWRRKYEREGRSGLSSRMGRPARGALGQFSAEMRETILTMRKNCPGWGALTLRLELAKDLHFTNQPLPSRSRIAAYLK